MPLSRFLMLRSFRRLLCSTGSSKRLRILGIETSCDDTGVAVVDSDRNILGESKYSQSEIHVLHGGIMPNLARELHIENIKAAVDEAVEKSKLGIKDMDAIAVTVKPGIPATLEVGMEYAKDLCSLYSKPLIPIHHMEAHALTIRLLQDVEFPFLVLLTSGGHCILALAESVTKFSVLGETADISPGVFFDKAARRLNLRNIKELIGMQGGVAIETAARKGNPFLGMIPLITKSPRDCTFYITGYQTALNIFVASEERRLNVVGNGLLPNVYDICAEIQFELFKYICGRVEIGMRYLDTKKLIDDKNRTLVVSGGVASNEYFRKMLKHVCHHYGYRLLVPPKNLCTDNGVMIAWNGIERMRENVPTVAPHELDSVRLKPTCSIGESLAKDIATYASKEKLLKYRKIMKEEMEKELKNVELIDSRKPNLALKG